MIVRKTTLILGAGASAPYGYPIGRELCNRLMNSDEAFNQRLDALGKSREEWGHIQGLIHDFQPESIDVFLRQYGEHADWVKLAIAHELSRHETLKAYLAPEHRDPWYRYLYLDVLWNDPALGGGKLSIVTFNYDLSLEAYLITTLKARHRMSHVQAIEALTALNIQHIYSDLGPTSATHGEGREYGNLNTPEHLLAAANGISTCFEPKSRDSVAAAYRLIQRSAYILFLDFGYSGENLERLNLEKALGMHARILASTYRCPGGLDRLRSAVENTSARVEEVTDPGGGQQQR
jgi:hypothetical protein